MKFPAKDEQRPRTILFLSLHFSPKWFLESLRRILYIYPFWRLQTSSSSLPETMDGVKTFGADPFHSPSFRKRTIGTHCLFASLFSKSPDAQVDDSFSALFVLFTCREIFFEFGAYPLEFLFPSRHQHMPLQTPPVTLQ